MQTAGFHAVKEDDAAFGHERLDHERLPLGNAPCDYTACCDPAEKKLAHGKSQGGFTPVNTGAGAASSFVLAFIFAGAAGLHADGGRTTRKPACPKTNMTALTQNAPARVRRLAAPERASSMRPASHANLHLINTRGVFAARAACVPICAFCIWRFLRSTATSVFQPVFTDDALFFHGGHAAQTSSFVRRLQAVFTRLGLPRAGDTRKNRSGFAGFEMLPRAVSARTSCYEGRSEKSACASSSATEARP